MWHELVMTEDCGWTTERCIMQTLCWEYSVRGGNRRVDNGSGGAVGIGRTGRQADRQPETDETEERNTTANNYHEGAMAQAS